MNSFYKIITFIGLGWFIYLTSVVVFAVLEVLGINIIPPQWTEYYIHGLLIYGMAALIAMLLWFAKIIIAISE